MALLFGKPFNKEIDLSDVRPKGEPLSPMEQGLGVALLGILKTGQFVASSEPCSGSAPMILREPLFKNQRLVDIFVDMDAHYRKIWLTKPVLHVVEEDYKNRKVSPRATEPLFVNIVFDGGPILQYPDRTTVCDIASALQECTDFKPSDALKAYLNEHRKIQSVVLGQIDPGNALTYRRNPMIEETYSAIYSVDVEDKPTRFSDAPFKVIRDYLYACSFLSPYAPGFVDYANDLLAYRLSYAISQEKDIGAREAISDLARDLNDFAKNHADGAWGLRASTKVELFSGAILPALTVRSDFGILVVQYEPELTMLDWENRYVDLRHRHPGR